MSVTTETRRELEAYLVKLGAEHRVLRYVYGTRKYRHCTTIHKLVEESEEAEFTTGLLSLLADSKAIQMRIATSLAWLILPSIERNEPLWNACREVLVEAEKYQNSLDTYDIQIAYSKVEAQRESTTWGEKDVIYFFSYFIELSRFPYLRNNIMPSIIASSLVSHIGNEAPRNLLRERFYLDETATTRYHKGEDL